MNLILLFIVLIAMVTLLFILFKSLNLNLLITIICSLFIVQLVLAPKLCINSALLGADLFIKKVFPSLFPFLVITSIMMAYDGIGIYSRFLGKLLCKPLKLPIQCTFAVIVSLLCGYPLGAKYACDLYETGHIDFSTCERLVNIASNASPLFVIGSVGTAMLNNTYLGYMLLISNYLSCLIMGLILPAKSPNVSYNEHYNIPKDVKTNIGNVVKEGIDTSIKTSLNIGGFVILFSVIISIIKSNILFDIAVKKLSLIFMVNKSLVEGILLGTIEMTNGTYLISNSTVNIHIKLIFISFMLGFSGLSIISQVFSFTYKHNLSMKKYISRKLVQGLICSIFSILLFRYFPLGISIQTFSTRNKNYSSAQLTFLILFILFVPLIFNKLKNLFHIS